MNTIELIKDVCLFGGSLPKERTEEVRLFLEAKETSSKELNKIEIVFDDSLKAEIETTDKNLKVLRAVNGWGYSINKEKIHINESKQ